MWGGLRGDRRDQRAQKRAGCQALRFLFLAAPWISVLFPICCCCITPHSFWFRWFFHFWKSAESTRSFWRHRPQSGLTLTSSAVVQFGRLGLIELHTTTFLDFCKPLRAVLFSLVFSHLNAGYFLPVLSDRVCLYRIKLSCQRLINQKKIRGFKLTSSKQCLVVEKTKQQRDKDLFFDFLPIVGPDFSARVFLFEITTRKQPTRNTRVQPGSVCFAHFQPHGTTWLWMSRRRHSEQQHNKWVSFDISSDFFKKPATPGYPYLSFSSLRPLTIGQLPTHSCPFWISYYNPWISWRNLTCRMWREGGQRSSR